MPVSKAKPSRTKKKAAAPTPGGPSRRAPKAEGHAPVRAFIASLPPWQRAFAKKFDDIIGREIPNVHRAVKWHVPFYGVPDHGWFASFGAFKSHVKILFFKGVHLKPVPPAGESKEGRALDLREGDAFEEKLVTSWVRQAAAIPGWGA